jgi:hypothetical protein
MKRTTSSLSAGLVEPDRRRHRAEPHNLPGAQPTELARRTRAGEPGQRLERMAEQVASVAGAPALAVYAQLAPHGAEVQVTPSGSRCAQDAPGVKDLVRDQGRRPQLAEVAVALLNDLDGGKHLGHRRRGFGAGAAAVGEVATQADADLALDAGIQVVGPAQLGAVRVEAARRNEARRRAGEAEIGLHLRGGGTDLEAEGRNCARGLGEAALERVARRFIGRRNCAEGCQQAPGAPGIQQGFESIVHHSRPSS